MQGPGMFKAEAKAPIDVVVRRHDYLAGGSTGWHAHPYPVLITVITGTAHVLRIRRPNLHAGTSSRRARGTSTPAHGHLGRNETGQPATDISVIMAPVGGAFRQELTAPGPFCDF